VWGTEAFVEPDPGKRGCVDCDDHPPAHSRPDAVRVPRALQAAGAYSWRLLAIAGAAWVVAWCLTQLYIVVVPLVLALFLAAVIEPLVSWLRRWLPSGLATAIVFVALIGLLATTILWLSEQVRGQFDDLGDQARLGADQVERWLTTGPLDLDPQRVARVEQQLTSVRPAGGGLTDRILGRARQLVEVVGGVVLMVFAAFFIAKDGHRIASWILEHVDDPYRDDVRAVALRARTVLRWYLLGTAGVGLADASLLAVALLVLGVPLVLPLMLLTFAAAFFPIVGAVAAGALAALVALVGGGFQTALLVVLATIAIQQIEGNLLQPVIMGRAVDLHPLVTLSVVSAGLITAGLIGAFLAVPLTAIAAQVTGWYRDRPGPSARRRHRVPARGHVATTPGHTTHGDQDPVAGTDRRPAGGA
jgi:predicted PurR-regulated permease PerM